jgi:hypothetical protein
MHMFISLISSFFHCFPIKTGCFGVETSDGVSKSYQAFPERLRLPAAAPTTQAGRSPSSVYWDDGCEIPINTGNKILLYIIYHY